MAGTNYIYQFGGLCVPPFIQTDAEYSADAMRTQGWQPGIVRQEFLNKVDRQGNSMSAGLGQFLADNISGTDDIVDTLTPDEISALITNAISNMSIVTQPQFDNSQKPATTAFVQRALGNLSGEVFYGVNTNLTALDVGNIVMPSSGGLAFGLPLLADVIPGCAIVINGNGHGVAVSRQSSDVILNGTAGSVNTISVLEEDTVILIASVSGWKVIGGENHQAVSSSFEHLNSAQGYIKFPGGLIMQWGTQSVAFGPTISQTDINLPIAFTTGFLNGVWNFVGGNPPFFNNSGGISQGTNPLTQIKFYGYGEFSAPTEGIYWQVIGH